MSELAPLVSILIPAYNTRFFEQALKSALAQSYKNTEILVCDDSSGDAIADICSRYPDERIKYIKNPKNLGFSGNFTQCINLANGEYIKFLNDDDILLTDCVLQMVNAFNSSKENITLVTSRRLVINSRGEQQADIGATISLSHITCTMNGLALGDFVLRNSVNYIGEPTTVMFRKKDVDVSNGNLFLVDGTEYIIFADLCLWLRLLSKGSAVYIAEPLSQFRVHEGQEQKKESNAIKFLTERFQIVQYAIKLGFLASDSARKQANQSILVPLQKFLTNPLLKGKERKQLEEIRNKISPPMSFMKF